MPRWPDVGDPAPDFSLPSTEGPIHLHELLRDSAVLLVFYPKDDSLVWCSSARTAASGGVTPSSAPSAEAPTSSCR
jgi:peroxiredoxin